MTNFTQSRLKYICTSYNSNISIDKLKEYGEYPVFGAAGVMGYSDNFRNTCEYLGIIKDGAGIGRINLYPAKSSLLGTMAYILPNKDVDICWLKYCIDSLNLDVSLDKTTIPHIYFSEYGNKTIFCPPIEVQKSIANFLDQKCSEIDSLSADIQSQIDILEEYKKSVIAEAVTKGLNPNVEMKDSETKWLGMIPQRWDVSKIGSVYTLRNTKVSDYDYPPLSVTMKGIVPQLETAAKTNAHDDRKLVKKGDFAINSRSDRRGSCGIADRDGSISLINTVLCPKGEMNPSYYNWLFHTVEFADEFYANGHGIVDDLWTTGWQEMKRIWIPLPPLSEQKEIADYLDTKCAEIDAVIADKKAQLETLAEYKKSLIYEYVTGKKEVPDNV